MKRILTAALLVLISSGAVGQVRVDFNETYTGGTIVEKDQSKPADDGSVVVTITVTPDDGYTIAKEDVVVVLTRSTSQTRDENPSIAEALQLEGKDPDNLGDERDYSFTVAAGFGAWVMEATFHKTDDANDISNADSQVTWALEEGTLTISGTGGTKDFDSDDTPWNDSDVTSVVIEKDVTSLGAGIFADCSNLTSITIANAKQVLTLGEGAIPANDGLEIDVQGNLYNEYLITEGWEDYKVVSKNATQIEGFSFSKDNEYDAFFSKEAMQVPSVLKAYTITGIDEDGLVLTPVTEIPVGEVVLLFTDHQEITNFYTVRTDSKDAPDANNLLKVVTEKDGKKVNLGDVWLLYNDVFYYTQAGIIPQNGIYLAKPEEKPLEKARSYYPIAPQGEKTAIMTLRTDGTIATTPQKGWYSLDGRKYDIMPTRKGIYIKDGKKVVIK
ncbi:MAG: hypothetical protein IKD75_12020 [Prevotella sp.]|nr:hypothetical protein [Prevotella sp.]